MPLRDEIDAPLLDRWMPRWHFREVHSIGIRADPERIGRAIRELTPGEIPLVRALLWLRQPWRRPSKTKPVPILEAAQGERFLRLEDTPGELVMGLAGQFWRPSGGRVRLDSPEAFREFEVEGFAKTAINFRVTAGGDKTKPERILVTTETRIETYGGAARVKFGLYWFLVVRWGSGWIRMLWLRAIRKRAEAMF